MIRIMLWCAHTARHRYLSTVLSRDGSHDRRASGALLYHACRIEALEKSLGWGR